MNYLGHFVLNHEVQRREPEPYFVMGVALPDLWPRFSRVRRIRWAAVRAAAPPGRHAAALRSGLLCHVDVDRRFHALRCFVGWQAAVKAGAAGHGLHSSLLDFLAHVCVELALDHRLVRADPGLPERFYRSLAECDVLAVERCMSALAHVDARGLGAVIQQFLERRFLCHYACRSALRLVVGRVLELIGVGPPPEAVVGGMLDHAAAIVDAERVWCELAADSRVEPARAQSRAIG